MIKNIKNSLLLLFCILGYVGLKGQTPIEYILNKGQWQGDFKYRGNTPNGDIFLGTNHFRILLADQANHTKVHNFKHGIVTKPQTLLYHAYDMNFVNSNKDVAITDAKQQSHYYNYFLGNDKSKWANGIHPAHNVNYTNLYNNIDLHVYSDFSNIKYDWIVKAGANVSDIKIKYAGIESMSLRKNMLVLKTSLGENIENKPYAYQFINDEKVEIKCSYEITDNSTLQYKLGKNYNPNFDLVIDPVLVFCSFTGSTADNWGWTATPGANGEFFAGGIAHSQGYPVTVGAFQQNFGGGSATTGNTFESDISITKFFPNGNNIYYATYIGGANNDQPHSIIANKKGWLFITGVTYSNNFPFSTGCFDSTSNGGADMYVTVLDSLGKNLIGSTYFGGTQDDGVNFNAAFTTLGETKHHYADNARSEIILDANDNIFVATNTISTDFPLSIAPNPLPIQNVKSGGQDAAVFSLNSSCSQNKWSTYLGGTGRDAAYVLSIDKKNPNMLYVAGGTTSNNFQQISTSNVLHTTYQGGTVDGFLLKFNLQNKQLLKGTYIGTNAYDQVFGLTTDAKGSVYIMGQSQGPYPTVGAGVQGQPNSSQFAAKLDSNLTTHLYAVTYGSGSIASTDIAPNAFLVDVCENIYISGWGGDLQFNNPGSTAGLFTTANAYKPTTDGDDFYFIVWDSNFNNIIYATFFGQNNNGNNEGGEHVDGGTSRFDENGIIYQAICANCGSSTPKASFPTSAGAFSTVNNSLNCNLGAVKLDFQLIGAKAKAAANPVTTGCAPFFVQFTNNSTNAISYVWDFGDGSPTTITASPNHTYNTPGTYNAKLLALNPNGCLGNNDSTIITIIVKNDSVKSAFVAAKKDSCNPFTITAVNNSIKTSGAFGPNVKYLWSWGDNTTSTLANPIGHQYLVPNTYTITLKVTDSSACNPVSIYTQSVNFNTSIVSAIYTLPDTVCVPSTQTFVNSGVNPISYFWDFGDGNTSTAISPTHNYTVAGIYTSKLVVTNINTCNIKDSMVEKIVVAPKIGAAFTYTKTDTCDPYKIAVVNTSTLNTTYPGALGWTKQEWNWGDGTTFIGGNPSTKTYATFGSYTITLTIKDSTSCNSPQILTQPVTFIDNNVRAKFEMPDTVCVPYTQQFTNQSTNATSYLWDFGGGNTSVATNPIFNFDVPGTYTINLTANNPTSCNLTSSRQKIITSVPKPIVDFIFTPDPPQANKPIYFINKSTGADKYVWDFGDNTSSTEYSPKHLYNINATLNACLTGYNQFGCSEKKCKLIQPKVNFIADIPTGFTPNGDGENDYVQLKGFGIQTADWKIYNRWGELVFSSNLLDAKWDGYYKGVIQEVDAYAYILNITFTDGSKSIKKGSLNLIK